MKKIVSFFTAFALVFALAAFLPGGAEVFESVLSYDDEDESSLAACFPMPYKVVALKSHTNGCYVTCDIGTRSDFSKYSKMDDPDLNVDASSVAAYEMFELVPCTDGTYAIKSTMNRKYLSYSDSDGLKCNADGIDDEQKIYLIRDGSGTKLKFYFTDKYISVKNKKLSVADNTSDAEWFTIETLSDNAYTQDEMNLLGSSEWFDINGEGVGYWNIQQEIGKPKESDNSSENTESLRKLGYQTLKRNDRTNKTTIEYDNMQCAVGVKKTADGKYDVIITFQGTGGYHDECDDNDARDAMSNVTGSSISVLVNSYRMHEGYYKMAKKLADNEANVGGNVSVVGQDNQTVLVSVTLEKLISEAKKGNAHFTILGHSMGGAIAQCYALHLYEECGVGKACISGRTFNSALAVSSDVTWPDWYNLRVSTDTVADGHVPGSIVYYGYHCVGQSVCLYDSTPDQQLDYYDITGYVSNILKYKHDMADWGMTYRILDDIQNKLSYQLYDYWHNGDGTITIHSFKNNGLYISIPSKINGLKVTKIGYQAFRDCTNLRGVVIPSSVTYIDQMAFQGCTNLVSVTIPGSVTEIGGAAFWGCTNLETITLPSSITSISSNMFYECTALKNVIIPDSVTTIGEQAFFNCESLVDIDLPENLTSIEGYVFTGCTGLESIVLPDKVTSIGDGTFELCSALTSVVIPDGVKSIGAFAFYECGSLKSIVIPDSVTSIGERAFQECSSLEKATLSNSLKSIENMLFYNCKSLKSIVIPNSVTSIGEHAFTDCKALESVKLSEGVKTIDYWAFDKCPKLTSITIPKSVTDIGGRAFGYYWENEDYYRIKNFTIYGYTNSGAESYARSIENGFKFVALDATKLGDLNGDNDITVKDVTMLKQYLANWNVTVDAKLADVSGDGEVSVKDVTLLKQYIAKWNVVFKLA